MQMGRFIRSAMAFLVLGSVLNLGVAWVTMTKFRRPPLGVLRSNPRVSTSMRSGAWGYARDDYFGMTILRGWGNGNGIVSSLSRPIKEAPAWSLMRDPPRERRDQIGWRFIEEARGWPLRSFLARYVNEPRHIGDSHLNVVFGWPIYETNRFSGYSREYLALPTKPIWMGVLVNTPFYAILLWLLWGGPLRLRRARRLRRGHCPACGYDLTGADHERCPECGMTIGS